MQARSTSAVFVSSDTAAADTPVSPPNVASTAPVQAEHVMPSTPICAQQPGLQRPAQLSRAQERRPSHRAFTATWAANAHCLVQAVTSRPARVVPGAQGLRRCSKQRPPNSMRRKCKAEALPLLCWCAHQRQRALRKTSRGILALPAPARPWCSISPCQHQEQAITAQDEFPRRQQWADLAHAIPTRSAQLPNKLHHNQMSGGV